MTKADIDFLQWIYSRLLNVHGENRNADYMLKLASIINIKQPEPTYKYQFAYLPMGSTQYEISEYMTEEEAEEKFRLIPCEKIESTKKEKK